jgi:hypothetical protein
MPRSINAPPAETVSDERLSDLQDSVQSLAHHVEVLREAIDDVREELQWALRNLDRFSDLPMHSLLKSMASDPAAPSWADRLKLLAPPNREKLPAMSDEAMDQMELRVAHIAEGQLELILSALDDLRLQLLSAVSGKTARKKPSGVLPSAEPATTAEIPAMEPEGEICADAPALPESSSGVGAVMDAAAPAPSPPGQQKSLWDR